MTKPSPQPAPRRLRSHGAYWFLLPNGLGFLAFTLLPVLAALALSLSRWDPLEGWRGLHWAGLGNYVEILSFHRDAGRVTASDPAFWQSLYNTLYLMLGIPLGMAASLFTALLLNQKLRGIVLWRALFFVPTICSAVAVAALWKWIYQPDVGLLNAALRAVGLHGVDWLGDPAWAKPALILMGLWVGVGGYNAVLYLAGLQNIPPELYEAAAIDGAGFWQRLRYITWPQLAPTTFFILVMAIIGGFQGHFVAIQLMTAGGPAGSTTTLLYYLYEQAFAWHQMGYACALAVVLLALVFVFTLVQWRHGGQGLKSQY